MVFEKVKAILSEQFDVEEDSITAETTLADDLGADSLDVVDLLMSIEDEFEVEIPDEEVENIKTVGRFGGVHRRPHQRVSHTVNLNFGKKRARAAARALFLPAARKALPFPKRKGARPVPLGKSGRPLSTVRGIAGGFPLFYSGTPVFPCKKRGMPI